MSSPCFSRMRPPLEAHWQLMLTSSVGSDPGWNCQGCVRWPEMIELKKRVHGRRAEDGRDGKDASRARREHEAANIEQRSSKPFIFKAPSFVPIQKSSGVRGESDRPKGVPPSGGGARAGMMRNRVEVRGHMIEATKVESRVTVPMHPNRSKRDKHSVLQLFFDLVVFAD